MRITKPNSPAVAKGNNPPQRPDWFVQWLKEKGTWFRLKCDCIEDLSLPSCIELLTGKKIYVLCPNGHGFQPVIAKVKFRDVLKARGIELAEPPGLIPPF